MSGRPCAGDFFQGSEGPVYTLQLVGHVIVTSSRRSLCTVYFIFVKGKGGANVWSLHPLGFSRIYSNFWLSLWITAIRVLGSRIRTVVLRTVEKCFKVEVLFCRILPV